MKYNQALKNFYKTHLGHKIPATLQATALLRGVSFFRIPLLFSVKPTVIFIDENRAEVKIPLRRWTKNHLGSMYFGALAIGADAVVGILALYHIEKHPDATIHLSFKDFQADFLKRPMGDVHFICEYGKQMSAFVQKVIQSGERLNLSVPAMAIVPKENNQIVAKFHLTLSLKRKP